MFFLKDFFWRIKEFIKNKINSYLDRNAYSLQREWSQNSNILFTQMKSGTTYLKNFFAALNYIKFDFKGEFDLFCPEKYGVFRFTRHNYLQLQNIRMQLNKRFNYSMPFLFITHHREKLPKVLKDKTKIIMTTRNIVDWVDSALDFKFVRRKKLISRDQAIKLLLKRYKKTHNDQMNIKKTYDQSIIVDFENLFDDKEIIKIFKFLNIEIDLILVNKVKKLISKEEIIKAEKKMGKALIGSNSLNSFFNDKKNKSKLTNLEIKKILNYQCLLGKN